jgi:hypothetical protein
MNWLRQLFQGCEPEPPVLSAAPSPNLAEHDEHIEELAESLLVLRRVNRRLNREPVTARVRGQYDRRPARPARWHGKENPT